MAPSYVERVKKKKCWRVGFTTHFKFFVMHATDERAEQ